MIQFIKRNLAALVFVPVMALANVAAATAWADNVVVHIDVQGMTCPLCVSMINKALRETQGVLSARASLPNREAVVVMPEGTDTQRLIDAIAQTGYTGTVKSVEPHQVQQD